jgi:hypothetical protein
VFAGADLMGEHNAGGRNCLLRSRIRDEGVGEQREG